jgi:8-hydroxy-5-deazaflavin:NADPH oxidoreductase
MIGGTGKEGPGLALRWASVGYPVLIGSRNEEKAQATARQLNTELGALGVDFTPLRGMENRLAARAASLCVLTVVHTANREILESLKEELQGKILVDTTARVDFRDPRPPSPPSAARTAQEILGEGVRVVAAFQNVPSHVLKEKVGGALQADVLVCADDLEAAREVMEISEAAGMRAFYAGSLDNASVVEGLTSLLISINRHYRCKTASIQIEGIKE